MMLNVNSLNFANINFGARKLESARNLTKQINKKVTMTPDKNAIIKNEKKIIKLLAKGFSLKQIAEKLELKLTELYRYSKTKRIKQKFFAKRNQKIMELYKKGVSVSEIAKEFNISESVVRALASFNSQRRNAIRNNEAIKLLQKGAPLSEIEENINVCKRTIQNISLKTGVMQNRLVNRNIEIINNILKTTSKDDIASQFVFLDKIYKKDKKLQQRNNSLRKTQNVIRMLREGWAIAAIALENRVSKSFVKVISARTNAYKEGAQAKYSKAIEMLRQGKKYKEIAQELGITEAKIKELSSKSSAHSEYIKGRNTKVYELYKNNYTPKQIAKDLDLDIYTVYNILRKFKV